MPVPRFKARCHMTPPSGGEPVMIDAIWAAFSSREIEPGQKYCAAGEPVWADPPDASTPLANNVQGKVVLIVRGNVDWITKAEYAQQAGAVGVVFINSEDSLDPMPVDNSGKQAAIPCVMIARNALNDQRLQPRALGRGPMPGHSNPDGPSYCTIFSATTGEAGTVDFRALVDGLPGLFEDPDFPANSSSLYVDPGCPMQCFQGRQIIWKRPHELSQQPALFVDDENEEGDGAEANDIMQGQLGDCFFLSSVAIIASASAKAQGQNLVQKLFVKTQYFDKGLVGIRFFKDGHWKDVAIDTSIPCLQGRAPCFVRMKDPNEFWMMMLEKAYAKLHGCYESLDGGFMNESLVDLTGAAPGRVNVIDLFAACTSNGRIDKVKALQLLSSRSKGTLLQGASSDAGGCEEAIGAGLYSGHAYSINKICQTSTGEALVQLRNPWGGHEWKGAWCDSDTRWTPQLMKEVGQTDKEDGMFFMGIDDFAKCFTEITFVDIPPKSFTVRRIEGAWSEKTAGGCANHPTWRNNPQILMNVRTTSQITISLNQPDNRMKSKTMGKAKWDQLFTNGCGYEEAIGFAVFQGSERKAYYRSKEIIAQSGYSACRTVSVNIPDCEPGSYIIVPTTFDPNQMNFVMRVWSDYEVQLMDTAGGQEAQIYEAGEDAIDKAPVPTSFGVGQLVPVEEAQVAPMPEQSGDVIQISTGGKAGDVGMLAGITDGLKKARWKVGETIPSSWEHGVDFTMSADNTFQREEMICIMRSDHTIRFGKITEVFRNGTYDVKVANAEMGAVHKSGVPAMYIGKLAQKGGYPRALIEQVQLLFDILDADGSGYLEVTWNSSELASDLGKRLLLEMGIDPSDMYETYKAMKELDANGDGRVDRAEFTSWMADRSLKMA